MMTIWRFLIYLILLTPVAYAMGITFADRRLENYLHLAVLFGPLFLAFCLHRILVKNRRSYRAFFSERGVLLPRLARLAVYLLLILWLVMPTFVLTVIGAGLMPYLFVLLAILIVIAISMQFFRRDRYPQWLKLDPPLIMLLLIYTAVLAIGVNAFGSSDQTCRELAESPYLKPIITRGDIDRSGEVQSCFLYDVKSDPAADRLFFTLKQKRSGMLKSLRAQPVANDAIGSMSFTRPDFEQAKLLPIQGESTARYPQRITVNPAREEIYVVVLDIDGRHAVRVISYAEGFRQTHELFLDFEPIRTRFKNDSGDLIIVGYEGRIGVYDIDTYQRRRLVNYKDLGMLGLFDTIVPNADGGAYYASVVSREFLLLDGYDFQIRRRRNVGAPTIGLDYDPRSNKVYAAATLTREILVLDGATLEVQSKIATGATVRELYLDQRRNLIVTAGYTGGELDFYDLDNQRRRARLPVGKLARGIHLEPQSGRLFVTSSCGLFEVDVDGLLASHTD